MRDPPIFVVGVPRSGTTLVRFMLNSNRRIHIPPESDFIPRYFGRDHHAAIDRARAELILDRIFTRSSFVSQWLGERPSLSQLVGDRTVVTPADFLDALYGEYARQYGATRWGDKTPIHTDHIETLIGIFPDAQIVHVIRDGRDVVASTIEKWSRRRWHIDPYYAARKWATRTERACASGVRLGPGQYFEIRYEQLVSDPERVIRGLCRFLGEEYTETMVYPHHLAGRQLPPGVHDEVKLAITASRVGRWRDVLSDDDLRVVETVARDQLNALGFEPCTAGAMTGLQRVRYLMFAAKYGAFQSGRRALQITGVVAPN